MGHRKPYQQVIHPKRGIPDPTAEQIFNAASEVDVVLDHVEEQNVLPALYKVTLALGEVYRDAANKFLLKKDWERAQHMFEHAARNFDRVPHYYQRRDEALRQADQIKTAFVNNALQIEKGDRVRVHSDHYALKDLVDVDGIVIQMVKDGGPFEYVTVKITHSGYELRCQRWQLRPYIQVDLTPKEDILPSIRE